MKQFLRIIGCGLAAIPFLLAGCSKSPENTERPEAVKLYAPVLSHTAGDTYCTVSWSAVENASGYAVSTDGATWSESQTEADFEYTGLTPDTEYTVRVKAVGDGDKYLDSDAAEVKFTTLEEGEEPQLPEQLAPPVPVSQANVYNAMISWEAVENASGYSVSTDGGETWSDTITGLYYNYGGLTPETEYSVWVKALGDGSEYEDSEPAVITFTTQKAAEPDPTEYSYELVEWARDIKPGAKYLIVYMAPQALVIDKTSTSKPSAVDISAYYSAAGDSFVSNAGTDAYAYTIRDAGSGYFYLENPEGKNIGWSSGTDFSFSQTGDNARWEIVEGDDGYSFHINNVASYSGTVARRITYRGYSESENRDYNLFGAYNTLSDHTEYCEPLLYMHNKPAEGVDPLPDPEPEPGETLMYIPLTDPDKLFSGDKCLVVYTSAGIVRAMDYKLDIAGGEGESAWYEERPFAVDVRAHYSQSGNMFVHNDEIKKYDLTFTRDGSGYILTNRQGEYLTPGSGSALSFESSLFSGWTLAKGSAAGTMRVGYDGRSIGYSYNSYDSKHVFGGYADANLDGGQQKEARIYVLRSIEYNGGNPEHASEWGFPAQWDMSSAAVQGGKCYAASGNTEAYISAIGTTAPSISGSYLTATGWNSGNAAWLITVPVAYLTESPVTVEVTHHSSNSGPKDFVVSYSTDGVNFTKTSQVYTCAASERKSSLEFTPAVTGFPTVFYIKLEVKEGSKAVNGSAIQSGGTSRLYAVKLMKWYKE